MSTEKPPVRLNILGHVKIEHMIAGCSGGVLSTLVLHPLDLVKIRFQVNEGVTAVAAARPKYNGIANALLTIYKENGVRGLYQGVNPNVMGAGASWGLYFMFYNSFKQHILDRHHASTLEASQHLTAATGAGIVTLILTNPIWVAKTRLCLQYDALPSKKLAKGDTIRYRGMIDCMGKIFQQEGILGWYKGFIPGVVGVSHGAIQFMVYEEMKKWFNEYKKRALDAKLSSPEYLACAAISKVIAASTTYPYQVVRSRLQDQHRNYGSIREVISQTWKYEGAYGFYKGLFPALLRVVPACCITFITYEKIIQIILKEQKR